MLRFIIACMFLFFQFFTIPVNADRHTTTDLKLAFIRGKNLWTKINGVEKQITKEENILSSPQWSVDGEWILYQQTVPDLEKSRTEIWVYNVKSSKKIKIFYDGQNPYWAPNRNIVAFQGNGVLNVSNLKQFNNMTFGVDTYTWTPEGNGFIVSSSAFPRPDGWTNPILYKVSLEKNVEKLFVIPKNLSKGSTIIQSIDTERLTFSPDGQWISFIVTPTASLSMDYNMLCVISKDGKQFIVVDEVILPVSEPKWAESKNILGYIAGGGRMTIDINNKALKLKEFKTFHSTVLTPPHYADIGFTWVNDSKMIVSRVKEQEWSSDPQKTLPSLFLIDLKSLKQTEIFSPKGESGNYDPFYVKSLKKIAWYRKASLMDAKANIWMANIDGSDAECLLTNVEFVSFYQ